LGVVDTSGHVQNEDSIYRLIAGCGGTVPVCVVVQCVLSGRITGVQTNDVCESVNNSSVCGSLGDQVVGDDERLHEQRAGVGCLSPCVTPRRLECSAVSKLKLWNVPGGGLTRSGGASLVGDVRGIIVNDGEASVIVYALFAEGRTPCDGSGYKTLYGRVGYRYSSAES